jgi:hypothetical protein
MNTGSKPNLVESASAPVVARVVEQGFEATAVRRGNEISILLKGEADIRAKPHLAGFFRAVHGAALPAGMKVHVDWRALRFMNSSCFQDFVVWLAEIGKAPADNGYNVTFLADAKQYWQRRSLHALATFAPDRVVVEA